MTTPTLHEELRALAQAANVLDHNESGNWYGPTASIIYYPKDARFIAAASPDVVLGLLDENKELRMQVLADQTQNMWLHDRATLYEELRKLIDGGSESYTHEDAMRDVQHAQECRYENQKLREALEKLLELANDDTSKLAHQVFFAARAALGETK